VRKPILFRGQPEKRYSNIGVKVSAEGERKKEFRRGAKRLRDLVSREG